MSRQNSREVLKVCISFMTHCGSCFLFVHFVFCLYHKTTPRARPPTELEKLPGENQRGAALYKDKTAVPWAVLPENVQENSKKE